MLTVFEALVSFEMSRTAFLKQVALTPGKAAKATLVRNSGEKVILGRLIELLIDAERLNDQRPIINYRPV